MDEYDVELLPAAEDDLAAIWTVSPDRAAVTRASAEAERRLRRDPTGAGTYVAEGLYRLTVGSLQYYYAVDDGRRLVEVSVVRAAAR